MNKTKRMTTIALLFALAMVFSLLEGMIMPLFALPPGVKLGLSNIVVMYCMAFMGFSSAAQLTLLKGLFAFLTRGATAGFLATMGGMSSIIVMFILSKIFKDKKEPALTEKVSVSEYYDVVNFARSLQVPGFYLWGYNDQVCCPTSVYAAYNVISAPKESYLFLDGAHWMHPQHREMQALWIIDFLKK